MCKLPYNYGKGVLMQNIVTVVNVINIEYTALMQLLHDIYVKELPAVGINNPVDSEESALLMLFFANQYAYITELWARMSHEVRLLKRLQTPNKEAVDLATDKRDYLEKVMSVLKIKYYAARTMLKYHEELK